MGETGREGSFIFCEKVVLYQVTTCTLVQVQKRAGIYIMFTGHYDKEGVEGLVFLPPSFSM